MTTNSSTKRSLRRECRSATSGAKSGARRTGKTNETGKPLSTIDFRDRMRQIGELVRESFGPRRSGDYAGVTRDACRVVISLVIEALTEATERISTQDLAAVSKMLAEQRKLDIAQMEIERKYPRKPNSSKKPEAGRRGPLPERFGQIVDEIYGTNISDTTGKSNGEQS